MASEPHVAGHATHFLRRLDRVADRHVELALGLYRDPELVRELLGHVELDEGVDRVAVSIGTEHDGPFLVLTRDGKFVTCLAEGMSPGGLAVIGPERLHVAASRVERMRERLAQIDSLPEGTGELTRLYDRLHEAGPALAREDFEALARWAALLGSDLDRSLLACGVRVMDLLPTLAASRGRTRRELFEEALLKFHRQLAAWAHLLVLASLDARGWRRDDALDYNVAVTLYPAQATGLMMHAARGLWAIAQDASNLLPHIKAMDTTRPVQDRQVRDAGLAMIAFRSSKRRTEALKALGQPLADVPGATREQLNTYWATHVSDPIARVLSIDESQRADLEVARREDVFTMLKGVPTPIPIERAEDVPDDIVLPWMSTAIGSWPYARNGYALLVSLIPRLATAQASELFLPRAWCASLRALSSVEAARKELDHIAELSGNVPDRQPVQRAAPKIGRNDPCPCGSGKKHKNCCR